MQTVYKRALLTLGIFFVHTSFALMKGRPPNPGEPGSDLLPETKEFLKKLEKATSVQDIKRLQDEDETFMVHDFSESLPEDSAHLKKTDGSSSSSCKPAAKEGVETPLQGGNTDVQSDKAESGDAPNETAHSEANESTHEPRNDSDNDSDNIQLQQDIVIPVTSSTAADVQQEAAVPEVNSTAADVENKTAEAEEEVFELVDFGQSNELTEPNREKMSGYESLRHDHRTLAASVEHQMLDPSPKPSAGDAKDPSAGDAKDPKSKKRKKAAPQPPPPTKEELEETYKYEVLAPPDNSPVKLDFPASIQAQGEEHLSKHVPLTLYCDTCMAIAYQVHLAFDKFHRQVTRRPPTESEVYHLVADACQLPRYHEYGMLEVHGHRHISGPGCNQLEAEGGVKHSRGPWPKRLAERCEEFTEDIGELTMHEAWLRERRDPERFKMFMCFGEPPWNYCEKYGHMDAAAEAAARTRSKTPVDTETPIEAASRMAREAEEEETRRLAELDASEDTEEMAPEHDRDEL